MSESEYGIWKIQDSDHLGGNPVQKRSNILYVRRFKPSVSHSMFLKKLMWGIYMIEENGHRWFEGSTNDRCVRCQMKYGYYLDFKKALKEQPERDDIRELIKCKRGNKG